MILVYLAAIISSNLLVTQYGPGVSIATAFLFIGLDLTCKDNLQRSWQNNGLVWKMALLIGTGSIISYLFNASAQQVGIASCVAFAGAMTVDALIFQRLRSIRRILQINGSNVGGAAVDSVLFPLLAFPIPLEAKVPIMAGQFLAKVCGGFIWSLVLRRNR